MTKHIFPGCVSVGAVMLL